MQNYVVPQCRAVSHHPHLQTEALLQRTLFHSSVPHEPGIMLCTFLQLLPAHVVVTGSNRCPAISSGIMTIENA
jgi:hypothetical protein